MALLFGAASAHGQVFHNNHPGVWAMATAAWKLPFHMTGPTVLDCAGGPMGTMLVAKEYGSFEAVSAGYFDDYPFYADVVDKKAFEAVSEGVGLGLRPALENSGDFRHYYVGFSCDTGMNTPGSHLFLMDLDGHVEKLVDVTEFTAVVPDLCAGISEIGIGPDETLFVMLSGPSNEQRHLVSVDLAGVPGERVTSVLSEPELIALFPEEDGMSVVDVTWGRLFAVDDQGRLFLYVQAILENADGPAGIARVIVRLDPDGTMVEMTEREKGSGDLESSLYIARHPATGMQGGLEYDPAAGLIVGTGYGVWLMHPDTPGSATMIVAPEQVIGMASHLVGDDWSNRPVFAGTWGNCLARTEDGIFASLMYTYAAFQFDTTWLDLDEDGLAGHAEAALGTDPWNPDTDGGGISDGLERIDITDPLDASDDRRWADGPDGIVLTDEHVDAPFTDTFEPYGLSHHGTALWDGTVLVSRFEDADKGALYRFGGYGSPGQPTEYPSTEMPLAADRLGNVYTAVKESTPNVFHVARMASNGKVEEAIPANLVAALVGEEKPMPRSWAVDPDGRIWAGFDKGRVLRYTPGSTAESVYDGWQDLINAGTLDANGALPVYGCNLYLTPDAMAWEPVHGVMIVALTELYECGSSGTFISPVFVAIGYDNQVVRFGNSGDYPEIASWKGGGETLDIEPDWQGGFYLLLAHGVNRTLVHYDADWQATVMKDFGQEDHPEGNVLSLNYATDVIVTRTGKHYLVMGRAWGETPVHFVLRRFEPVVQAERVATLESTGPTAGAAPLPAIGCAVSPVVHALPGPGDAPAPGACRAGPAASALSWWLLAGLLGLLLALRRRVALLVAGVLLFALVGCAGSSESPDVYADVVPDQVEPSDGVTPDGPQSELPGAVDVVVPDPCLDLNECEPTAAAECVQETSHRRCQLTQEGCWVWSKTLECPAGQACKAGTCQECLPYCPADKTCGNDGCGGSCGECGEGLDCCLDTFCGSCETDCTDRECGADGNGGSCGECPAGDTCVAGICEVAGSGKCVDLSPCMDDCVGWDEECIADCEAYVDGPSHERAAAYMACISLHCIDCPDGEAGADCTRSCVFEHCAESFVECFAQGGQGTCKEMYGCVFACDPGDQACMDACYQTPFPSHLLYAIELELCVDEYCDVFPPDPAAWECWEEAVMGPCHTPFFSCMQGECDNSCEGLDCGFNDCLLPCGPAC